jgi:fermentation-respiration switch protein FrsA (DUF1100 family)
MLGLIDIAQARFETAQVWLDRAEAAAARHARKRPVHFIHSKKDEVVSYQHTRKFADLYSRPKDVWFPEREATRRSGITTRVSTSSGSWTL